MFLSPVECEWQSSNIEREGRRIGEVSAVVAPEQRDDFPRVAAFGERDVELHLLRVPPGRRLWRDAIFAGLHRPRRRIRPLSAEQVLASAWDLIPLEAHTGCDAGRTLREQLHGTQLAWVAHDFLR